MNDPHGLLLCRPVEQDEAEKALSLILDLVKLSKSEPGVSKLLAMYGPCTAIGMQLICV